MNYLFESDVFLNFNTTQILSTKIANFIPESIIPIKKIENEWLSAIEKEDKDKILKLIEMSEKNDLGVLSDGGIKKLHSLKVTLPSVGKVIFNPFQVKRGEEQIIGTTSVDLQIYKKRQILPVTLGIVDGNTVSGQVGGKNNTVGEFGYVVLIPAYGAKIKDENLDFYKEVFGKDLNLIRSGDNEKNNLNIFIHEEKIPIYAINDKNLDLFQKSITQGKMSTFISQQSKYKSAITKKDKASDENDDQGDAELNNESFFYKKSITKFLFESVDEK
jgi:hypothetical protein